MKPFKELREAMPVDSQRRADDEARALCAELRGWADWCRIPNVPGGPKCGREATHELWWVNGEWEPACDLHAGKPTDRDRVRPLATED